MSNTEIITHNIPNCIYCNNSGMVYQSNVHDPEGLIHSSWNYKRCENINCRLVWLDPAPLGSELWKAYTTYHTHTKQKVAIIPKTFLSIVNRIVTLALFPVWLINGIYKEKRQIRLMMLGQHSPGRLLDIGCGGGRFLKRMQRHGWKVEGVDFDAQATLLVTKKYGIKTFTGDLLSLGIPDESFNAVTMSHCIEHLTNPIEVLNECLRILKPGGVLVITTPNVESRAAKEFGDVWRGWEPPRHLYLFSINTLRNFLVSTGFKVEEIHSLSATSGTYRESAVNRRKKAGLSITFLFKLRLILWSYFQEIKDSSVRSKYLDDGQNLVAVATKPIS